MLAALVCPAQLHSVFAEILAHPGLQYAEVGILEQVDFPHSLSLSRPGGEISFLITTGMPPGVAFGSEPPVYLEDMDVLKVRINGLRTMTGFQRLEGSCSNSDSNGQ